MIVLYILALSVLRLTFGGYLPPDDLNESKCYCPYGKRQVDAMTESMASVLDRLDSLETKTHAQEAREEHYRRQINSLKREVQRLRKIETNQRKHNNKRQTESEGIAFSAYIDHQATYAANTVIAYDSILLNEGNAYNGATGIFQCPEAGVYLFSFFLSEAQVNEIIAELVVNDKNSRYVSCTSQCPGRERGHPEIEGWRPGLGEKY